MKISTELLRDTALYVKDYYNNHFTEQYYFHNYNRTMNIVRNCDALAVSMDLGKQELKLAHLAAWFLELGYSRDYHNYQANSVELAKEYFKTKDLEDGIMERIEECILSTRVPQQPVSLVSQLVCDASMYHLAERDALQNADALRAEYAAIARNEFTDEEWLNENIRMISSHFYFTTVARDLFQKRKDKTLAAYQAKRELLHTIQKETVEPSLHAPAMDNKILGEEDIKLERGVETFFRITERRHMDLSTKAHDKASLLISVNAIVMSIVLSVLITKLEENKYLLLPTLMLVITCSVTIVFSIISTRPRIIGSHAKNKPGNNDEVNILFFGDFANMSLAEYKKAMKDTYKNRAELYDSLSRDIYYQGIILVWKFKYINVSYNVFMYGFILTILAFIIAFAIHTR
ncbi:MAG: Pycsar system effector family protein [Chitinophagaceae bacterium]